MAVFQSTPQPATWLGAGLVVCLGRHKHRGVNRQSKEARCGAREIEKSGMRYYGDEGRGPRAVCVLSELA